MKSLRHACNAITEYVLQALKYRRELLDLFKYLHKKTLAKRGFSSAGKLLSSTLFTMTYTYPIENRFANLDEWNSEGNRYSIPCIPHAKCYG